MWRFLPGRPKEQPSPEAPPAVARRARNAEPVHLHLLSLAVSIFGDTRTKIDFDLLGHPAHAFGLLHAADDARRSRHTTVTVIQLGVGDGSALANLCELSARITRATGIRFQVLGLECGALDVARRATVETMRLRLPVHADLLVGEASEVIAMALARAERLAPIGWISVGGHDGAGIADALDLCSADAWHYLPTATLYLDERSFGPRRDAATESQRIQTWKREQNTRRTVAPATALRGARLFKRAPWIDRVYTLHVHDHPLREAREAEDRDALAPAADSRRSPLPI